MISPSISITKEKSKKKQLLNLHLQKKMTSKSNKRNNLKLKKSRKLFMNGNKLTPTKLYGSEKKTISMKINTLTFIKASANSQIHQ